MTERDKQIEEMARDICENRHAHITHECKECALSAICLYKETAHVLYKAGYRKQSEGEWVKCNAMPLSQRCSNCNGWYSKHTINDYTYPFCPNCGAKMKGGASDA